MSDIFNAVVEKFKHDVLDKLTDFDLEDTKKSGESIKFYLSKDNAYDDLDDFQREELDEKYFYDYEDECFEDWWRFNGDEYEKNYIKKHGNNDDIMCVAYEEWCEKFGGDVYNSFIDDLCLTLNYEITISENMSGTVFYFELKSYYDSSFDNENWFEETKMAEVNEVHLNQMTKIISQKFGLTNNFDDAYDSNIEDFKFNRIAKKIAKSLVANDIDYEEEQFENLSIQEQEKNFKEDKMFYAIGVSRNNKEEIITFDKNKNKVIKEAEKEKNHYEKIIICDPNGKQIDRITL